MTLDTLGLCYRMPSKKILTSLFIFGLLVIADYSLHPKVAKLIENEIRKETLKNNIDVDFSNVDYGYFPPHVTLENLSYKDNVILATAKSLSLSAQILPLMKGQIKANSLSAESLSTSIKILNTKGKPADSKDLDQFLDLNKILNLIPIEKLYLKNSKLILLQSQNVYNLDLEHLEFKKLFGKLELDIKSKIDLKIENVKEKFHLNTKLRWQDKGFFINFFTVQKEKSIVQISGFIKESILDFKKLSLYSLHNNVEELRLSMNADLEEFNPLLKSLLKKEISNKNPVQNFSGRVQASGYYFPSSSQNSSSSDKGLLSLKADDLFTPFVSIKGVDFKGEISAQSLTSKRFDLIFSESSKLSLDNFSLKEKSGSYLLSTDLESKQVRVEDVVKSLNLKISNLKTPVALSTHCGGSLYKNFLIKCKGKGEVLSFDILNLRTKSKLISTKNIKSNFEMIVEKTKLNFETDLSYKSKASGLLAKGSAKGSVDFIKGFEVEFESSPVDLDLINTISGLTFEGQTALKGKTKGSSRWGEFQADLKSTGFKLNKMFTGTSNSSISYKFPNLEVNDIKGKILEFQNSYSGDVKLDVDKNTLSVDLLGQKIDDEGLRTVFLDRFPLPIDLKFQSNFILSAKNNIDINKMDLSLNAKLTQLNIFGEQFESGLLELKGPGGKWAITKGLLSKGPAQIQARGQLEGLNTIDVRLVSDNIQFEDSTFLKKIGVSLYGPFKLILNAKGPLTGPEAIGTVTANNTLGPHKNKLGNSTLGYRLFEDDFSFKGSVFANSFEGEGFYPLSEQGRFALKGNFKNFDSLNFINLNTQNTNNTKLLINGSTDIRNLSSQYKGSINDFSISLISDQKNLLSVVQQENTKLSRPLVFKSRQKKHSSEFTIDLSKKNSKSILYSGSLNIDFLKPLIPSCELIQGEFYSDKIKWTSDSNTVKSEGSGKLTDGSFKTSQFPYSFSKITSDFFLKNDQISIGNLNSFVANTKINGSGSIKTSSPIRINLDVFYKNLSVEFPPKISTTSDAQLNIQGSKIPLSISGSLNITQGLFSQDVLASQSYEKITPNKRLPTKILRKSSPPAELNGIKIRISDKLQIKSNEADGNAAGNLLASGNPAEPILSGAIKLLPGLKINFQDNNFVLNEGVITYRNKAADSPDIFIDASTNIKDNNDPLEKNYSIRLLAKGEGADPDIKFSSQPSLDEPQIISLLTIGTVSTQSLGQEITAQEQATYSGLQFGSYLVQKNQALKDLQKQTGTQIGVSSSLNSGGVNPKVYVRKNWTPKSSSTISQTFGNQRNLTFSTEYKLNKKTSTVFGFQNNQSQDANQINNRRLQQNVILDLGLQYKFEFE